MDNYEIKKAELKIQILSSVAGAKGEEGESMYEIAKKNGFEGTEQEFIAQYMNVDARIGYYECDTDSSTAAKTCQGASFILPSIPPYGGSFKVKFANKNSAANPTLSINLSDPKPLYYNGAIASSTNTWEDGDVLDLYYDGTNFNATSVVEKFATGEKVKEVGIDSTPTAGSDNLVKSGGVIKGMEHTEKDVLPLISSSDKKIGEGASTKAYTSSDFSGIFWDGSKWVEATTYYNSIIIPLLIGQTISYDTFYSCKAFSYKPDINSVIIEDGITISTQTYTNNTQTTLYLYFLCQNASSWSYTMNVTKNSIGIEKNIDEIEEDINKLETATTDINLEIGFTGGTKTYTNDDYSGLLWDGTSFVAASSSYDSFIIPIYPGQKISYDTFYNCRIFNYEPELGDTDIYIYTVEGQVFTNNYGIVVYAYFQCPNASTTSYSMSVVLTEKGIKKDIKDLKEEAESIPTLQNNINNLDNTTSRLDSEIGYVGGTKIYTNSDYSNLLWVGVQDGGFVAVSASSSYNSFIIPIYPTQKLTWDTFYVCRIFDYEPYEGANTNYIQTIEAQEYTNNSKIIHYAYFQCPNASTIEYNVNTSLTEKGIMPEVVKLLGEKLNIVCFGDSITEITEYYDSNKHYSDYIEDFLNCKTYNFGIGGSRITIRGSKSLNPSSTTEAYADLDIPSMVEAWTSRNFDYVDAGAAYAYSEGHTEPSDTVQKLRTILPENTNVVTIFGGTNDWTSAGSFGTSTDADDGTSDNTLWGSLKHIVKLILTANPRIKIYIFSPIPRYAGYSSGETIEPDDAHWSDNVVIYGKKLTEYVSEILAIGEKQHLPSCDLYWTLGWNQNNIMEFMRNDGITDLTHPYRGLKEIGEKISKFISSN